MTPRELPSAADKSLVDLAERRNVRRTQEPSQVTVILPDNPDAILDALVERVGTAGVELMLRNRAKFAEAAE